MQALVFSGPWSLSIAERPKPAIVDGADCLVRIMASGICGTDLNIIRGLYPARPPVVLGHEATGQVVETGPDVRSVRPGDRVVIDPTFYCDSCRFCRTGHRNHCASKDGTEAGVSCDGTLAEYFVTGERFLYPLPPEIDFEEGTLTEPLSCVLTGLGRLAVVPSARAMVLGLGPIGLLYVFAMATRGVRGVAVEPATARRALAADLMQSEGWTAWPSIEEARRALGASGADILVDTSGHFDNSMISLVAPGGQVLAVALRSHLEMIDLGTLADRSISIVGSIDSRGTFEDARAILMSGRIPTRQLISDVVSMDRTVPALRRLGCDVESASYSPTAVALKIVIRVTQS